jgi:hypothetical protein
MLAPIAAARTLLVAESAATRERTLKPCYYSDRIFSGISLLADCYPQIAHFSRIAVPERTLLMCCSYEATFGVRAGQFRHCCTASGNTQLQS